MVPHTSSVVRVFAKVALSANLSEPLLTQPAWFAGEEPPPRAGRHAVHGLEGRAPGLVPKHETAEQGAPDLSLCDATHPHKDFPR